MKSLKIGRYLLVSGLYLLLWTLSSQHLCEHRGLQDQLWTCVQSHQSQDGVQEIVGNSELIDQLSPLSTMVGITYPQWIEYLSHPTAAIDAFVGRAGSPKSDSMGI